jgi:hypothetical protein
MSAEALKRVWGLPIVLTIAMLVLPWIGWIRYPSASIALAVANMGVVVVLGFAVHAFQQLVIALVARALGDRVPLVIIGCGPQLWSRAAGYRTLTLRLLPVNTAIAIATTRKRGQAIRTAVALLAGAVIPAGALVSLLVLHPASWTDRHEIFARRLAPDCLFIYLTVWLVYVGTVGAIMTLFADMDAGVHKARRAIGHALEAGLAVNRGAYAEGVALARRGLEEDPENPLLQVQFAEAMSVSGRPETSGLIEGLLKRDLPPALRAVSLNLRAWECYLGGDEGLRAEADKASLDAITALPDNESIIDTRGHVLLWNKQLPQAEQHFRRAFKLARARATRTSSASGLAMICAATNRPDEAAQWLARAREQDSEHVLVARATAAVEPLRRL